MKEREIIYVRESLLQSILADVFTYAVFLGSFYFSYHFIGNYWFVNLLILLMVLIFISAKASGKVKKFTSSKELIKYLEEQSQGGER